VRDNNVAFGFPDIYIEPLNIFELLADKFNQNKNADVLLGLVPIPDHKHWDMVEIEAHNKVKRLMLHSENGKGLKYGWAIAIWRPSFTEFLKNFVTTQLQSFTPEVLNRNEHSIGYVFQKAIDDGMNIYGTPFDKAVCIDAGTYQGIKNVMSKIKTSQNRKKVKKLND
jgi:glucose-1-phosphate thymidylyltransferase